MRRQSSTSAMLRESAASVGQGKREPHWRHSKRATGGKLGPSFPNRAACPAVSTPPRLWSSPSFSSSYLSDKPRGAPRAPARIMKYMPPDSTPRSDGAPASHVRELFISVL